MSAVDPMDELFDELWSMEYRTSGDKPRAKELAREFLDRHAHLLAERVRAHAWGRFQGFDDATAATALAIANLIDPEVPNGD